MKSSIQVDSNVSVEHTTFICRLSKHESSFPWFPQVIASMYETTPT